VIATAWGFGSVMWALFAFFFWCMAIFVFIVVFADIIRRHDLSGGGKAGWIVLLVILPLFGALIYLIVSPSVFAGRPGSGSGRSQYDALNYAPPRID
jgi:hypothetical protein